MPSVSPGDCRLPRARRLRCRREFDLLRTQGGRVVVGCLIMNWRQRPEGAASRVGIVTSRKLGRAVARSRARRLLRECFRQHQAAFNGPLDIVLVAREGIVGKSFAQVKRDFLSALRRAGLAARLGAEAGLGRSARPPDLS